MIQTETETQRGSCQWNLHSNWFSSRVPPQPERVLFPYQGPCHALLEKKLCCLKNLSQWLVQSSLPIWQIGKGNPAKGSDLSRTTQSAGIRAKIKLRRCPVSTGTAFLHYSHWAYSLLQSWNCAMENSLLIQWLESHVFSVEGPGSILG